MFGTAEAAEIEQSFGGAVEHHTHAIEEINDRWRGLAHPFNGRLIAEEVAPVDGVVEMNPGRVALAFRIDGAVDSTLRADRMRALYRNDGEKIDVLAGLGEFDSSGEPRETTADHDVTSRHSQLLFGTPLLSPPTSLSSLLEGEMSRKEANI